MEENLKQLLLKDLCGRFPYGVIIHTQFGDFKFIGIDEDKVHLDSPVYDEGDGWFLWEYEGCKPYLRPMSSMTEEEQEEFVKFHCVKFHCVNICPMILTDMLTLDNESKMFDWLNKKMFDYRGLIPMGLALPAKEGMYE
jgi:hypothetical protein